jgi:hypothetical protein
MARLLADAVVYTRQQLGPHQSGIAQLVLQEFTNHVSDEVRGVMRPIWLQFAENDDTPTELKPLFKALATERGQAWAWIAGNATGAATASTLGDLFGNLLAPVVQSLIAEVPNALLSPEAVASAIARGLAEDVREIDLPQEARKGGMNNERLDYLIELARQYPPFDALTALWHRKLIRRDEFLKALERAGIPKDWRGKLIEITRSEMTLPDISAMWNRAIVDEREAVNLGARVGYDETQVRRALELGGEPLPPDQLAEAYRRGFIDLSRYNRGIIQGPLRNEWFDVLAKLQFHRMSPVDAADAVNQGHMDAAEGKRIAHENGLDPRDFETLIETAGAPPGVDFATEALNRGFINEAQFRSMFLESRIKNKYNELLLQMRTRLIPQETVRLLYREGVYSREATLRTLMQHGFTSDDAAALVALEEARQDEGTKELTRAQIVQMYDEQILDADTTRQLLTGLGYSDANVELMMALADVKRTQRFINAAITRIRSAFLTGKIDEQEVSIQLDALSVPASQRDELLAIWSIDRSTVSKTLTATQIRQAFKNELITRDNAMERLTAQGYDEIDADLFLKLTA